MKNDFSTLVTMFTNAQIPISVAPNEITIGVGGKNVQGLSGLSVSFFFDEEDVLENMSMDDSFYKTALSLVDK